MFFYQSNAKLGKNSAVDDVKNHNHLKSLNQIRQSGPFYHAKQCDSKMSVRFVTIHQSGDSFSSF